MFRRNKGENKAKLEHKLYLARETPEPVFDLSECDLKQVPHGIFSLCRVFLKEVLRLENNSLGSLSGGGQLGDLHNLKVLDLHNNAFVYLPEDIHLLINLKELYVNNNHLKRLPDQICNLNHLTLLNVANNAIKFLPENIGNLKSLRLLCLNNNKLKSLPKSISNARKLTNIDLDPENFVYPPENVLRQGTESIKRFICNDVGIAYITSEDVEEVVLEASTDQPDAFEAKIWTLETLKKQKMQDFLELERANELSQRQEFELANAQKYNRAKLLADITQQQHQLDQQLTKLQQEKDDDRFKLIELLISAEQNADLAIKQLLELSGEPTAQLLAQEQEEEERLLAAANRYNQDLRKSDILAAMQDILQQELQRFKKFDENRLETSRTILEEELNSDNRLDEILQLQDSRKADLVSQLQEDSYLQKAAVGTLLERGDARSWGLVQQVRLVESQLVALTQIEIDRKKLQVDEHITDLADKRVNLSILLMDLLEQQNARRAQLISTLQTLEETGNMAETDFWLRQYQTLLDKLPNGLSEAQKNIDPDLAQALLMNGVISCLPFLAKLTQSQCDILTITENELLEAGVVHGSDRLRILDAFQMYKKQQPTLCNASAPLEAVEEASAPSPEQVNTVIGSTECVVCMDKHCEVIFVPCGHFCSCVCCSSPLVDCPMCRATIERKIKVIAS